jgi:hypothetical protein
MEHTAIVLIVITLFLLAIIVGLLTMLIYRLMKQPSTNNNQTIVQSTGEAPHPDVTKAQFHPEILNRLSELEKIKPRKSELFCPNHSDEPGEVTCAICDKLFCVRCIKPFKSLHFCKEHIPLVMKHEWEEVLTVKTSTQDPEEGVRLYDAKRKLFEEKELPTYIETHYKINVDHDFIETYLVVFSIRENSQLVKQNFQDI